MDVNAEVHTVGEVIELALAPVFLLVAIGSFLNVVTQRLARAIDRSRALEQHMLTGQHIFDRQTTAAELSSLGWRIALSQWAINFCAIAALLIAVLVIVLFLGDFTQVGGAVPVAVLFSLSMLALVVSLCLFLAEIFISTRSVRVHTELLKP